jgi:hypothetical protein
MTINIRIIMISIVIIIIIISLPKITNGEIKRMAQLPTNRENYYSAINVVELVSIEHMSAKATISTSAGPVMLRQAVTTTSGMRHPNRS